MRSGVTSAAEARAIGAKRYFTGRPCPKGHVADRFTARGVCVECHRLVCLKRYQADPERAKRRIKAWGEANPEKVRAYKRAYKQRKKGAA